MTDQRNDDGWIGRTVDPKEKIRNPLGPAVRTMLDSMLEVKYESPYVQAVIQVAVFAIVLAVLALSYVTFGVASVGFQTLVRMIADTLANIRHSPDIFASSGYVVAAGVLLIVAIPFFLLQLPVMVLGFLGTFFSNSN
ncbi:MAG: hypothetical protein GY926_06790 [bacterium]|nr:hypothetical protein [bacterium]